MALFVYILIILQFLLFLAHPMSAAHARPVRSVWEPSKIQCLPRGRRAASRGSGGARARAVTAASAKSSGIDHAHDARVEYSYAGCTAWVWRSGGTARTGAPQRADSARRLPATLVCRRSVEIGRSLKETENEMSKFWHKNPGQFSLKTFLSIVKIGFLSFFEGSICVNKWKLLHF